jgi:hypothetical protein
LAVLTGLYFSYHDSTAKQDPDVATKKDPDVVKESDHYVAVKKDSDVVKKPNNYVANSKDADPSMQEIVRVQELLKQDQPVDNVIKNLTAVFVKGLKSEK